MEHNYDSSASYIRDMEDFADSYQFNEYDNDQFDKDSDCNRAYIEKSSDELLIDCVRGYPHLYNSSLKEYKDVKMKENSWKEISSVANLSVECCQNRWLRLRDRFTKEQRLREIETRSGSGANHRPIFSLYNNMLFLSNHIKRRRSFTNVSQTNVEDSSTIHSSVKIPTGNIQQTSTMLRANPLYQETNIVTPQETRMMSFKNDARNLSQNVNPAYQETNISKPKETRSIPYRNHLHDLSQDANPSYQETNISKPKDIRSISYRKTVHELSQESNNNNAQQINKNSLEHQDFNQNIIETDVSPSSSTSHISSVSSPAPQTMLENTKTPVSKHITKKRNSACLESSLTNLTNILQHHLVNQSSTSSNVTDNTWTHVTVDTSFGMLVAAELERIPEPEKSTRKQAIANILWKPFE